ncbi:MAG: ankyrin repeat domain-containing protein, partial [Gammaproteobacteria bacterium]|nr:ankyrin repeat domain-containing protein [Gammaproteobacteria bacterium]
ADIDFETSTNITAMKLATKRIQDLLNIQKVKEQNLFIAITKQDLDNIGHININCRNKNSDTLLIAAVKADRANNVDMLLAEGIDINLSNSGGTALHWAVSKNNIRIVKTLLKKKEININKKNINGITPLMYACKAGHLELLNILLEAEADINLLDYKENGILNWAVINGHVKVVEVLLKQKRINLNQQNREGLSPLMEASIKGDLHMVNILLKAGAVVNLLDNEGNNSLFHAINNGHIQIAEVLINQKVIHLNHQNNQKITSLMLACYKNNIEIVKCLLNAGADFKLRDNEKTTAYDLTDNTAIKDLIDLQKMKELSFFGIIRTKKLKQFKNININCRNENSETLLIAAAKAGRADNVSVLLKAGANVNLVDFNQDGALSWAADKGHNQVIEVLLEQKDINLNQANRQGSTPLMEACKKGHVGIAITLINAGANITLKNTKNETALQLCKSNSIKYILKCVAAVKTLEIKTDTQISKDVVSRKKSTYLFKALVRTIKSNKPNPEARINAILKVLYSRDESVITLVIEDLRKVKLLNRSKPTQQFFKSLFDKKSIYLSREQSDKCNACITKLQESLQQRYQVSLEQPINLEEKLGEETKRNNSPIPEQKVLSQTDSSCNRIIMLNKVPLAGIDNNAIYLTEDKESGEFTAHWHEEGRLQAHKLPLETISALENYFKPGETVEKGTSDFDEMLFLCGYRQRNRYSKIERLSQFALFSNGNHETSPSLQPPPAPKSVSFLESII